MTMKFVPRDDCVYACDYEQIFRDVANGHLEDIPTWRQLIIEDLWFLVYFGLRVGPANHPFVVEACKEVEKGPKNKTLDLWAREHFKDLDVDTPVPTPSGWVNHGALKVGDSIYSSSGDPVKIIATEHFTGGECYKLKFDDDHEVIAGAGHLWRVEVPSRRRIPGTLNKRQTREEKIFTTEELSHLVGKTKYRIGIKLAKPIKSRSKALPIDSYLLGVWLGDGFSSAGVICGMDEDVFTELEARGESLKYRGMREKGFRLATVKGLQTALRKNNLFKNKHIPQKYLRAPLAQRWSLLQGLMDTDGTCDTRGTATFCNTNENIVDGLVELLHTLGIKNNKREHGFMREGEWYRFFQVSFQGYKDFNPFIINRKRERCKNPELRHRSSKTKYIDSIEQCESVPTNCIQVDSSDGMYLIGRAFIPTHNSTIITAAETIQDILINPESRIGIFSHTRPIAKGFLRTIKLAFESSGMLKACFPEVLYQNPQVESPKWSEDDGLIVRRQSFAKESTIEAWGLIEGMPTSKHFTKRIYDDIETADVVENPDMIEKLKSRFDLSQNLGTEDGTERVIGTTYHHEGVLEYIRKKTDIHGRRIYTTRIKPATHDGTPNGNPVLLSQQKIDELKANEHVFNCQQLLDPTPVGVRKLDSEQLTDIQPDKIPNNLYRFMVIDPAGDNKSGKGDAWGIHVVGVEPFADDLGASNVYILDSLIAPLGNSEAVEAIVRMYMNGGIILQVGVEKVALSTTEIHVANALAKRGRNISVEHDTLVILRPGGRDKVSRITSALSWPLDNNKIFISTAISGIYRERLRAEMDKFPYWHDDGLDALSYLYDLIKVYNFACDQDYDTEDYEPATESIGY